MRGVLCVLALLALAVGVGGQEPPRKTEAVPESPPKPKRAIDRAFRGRVVEIKKRRVTLFYDFEDPAQIEDFEEARPPRYLGTGCNRVKIEGGRLFLDGSTSIRHKMESAQRITAKFTVRVSEKRNVGAVVTEPVLSDFYVIYNLFEHRFGESGNMHVAACGLHEDEGAEDLSTGLVNYRDIAGGVLKKAEAGRDIHVEVMKDGWTELFQADDVKSRGSSKGKTKEMPSMKIGLFVHGSSASFDDLTITCELSDEYLDLENLRAEVDGPPAAKQQGR